MDKAEFVKDFSDFYGEIQKRGSGSVFCGDNNIIRNLPEGFTGEKIQQPIKPWQRKGDREAETVSHGFSLQKRRLYYTEGARQNDEGSGQQDDKYIAWRRLTPPI